MMTSLFRFLTLLSLALSVLSPLRSADLNARDFGATGNGINDDTAALNLALAAVKTQKRSLYIPAGVYRCDQLDANFRTLLLDAGGLTDIRIYGDGDNTHLTTSAGASSRATLLYIWAYSPCTSLRISNLKFSSTHPPATLFYQNGLFLQGTPAANLRNPTISEVTFSGFGNSLGGQGIAGWDICRNRFLSPRGHDDAQNSTQPAVHLWLHDNVNGNVSAVRIVDNYASGYTGTAPMSALITRRPMDGFVFGHAYGMVVTGNRTENFCEEHYLFRGPSTNLTSTARILCAHNQINAAIPPDSYAHDGTRKLLNYAIRCDASHATLAQNTIEHATVGILARTIDRPGVDTHHLAVIDNTITLSGDPATAAPLSAIYLIGGTTNPMHDLTVHGNTITSSQSDAPNYTAIIIRNSHTVLASRNLVQHLRTNISPPRPAFVYGNVQAVTHTANSVSGPLVPIVSAPGDQITLVP